MMTCKYEITTFQSSIEEMSFRSPMNRKLVNLKAINANYDKHAVIMKKKKTAAIITRDHRFLLTNEENSGALNYSNRVNS